MNGKMDGLSKGFALASSMLVVLLLAGLSVGMMYLVDTESRLGSTDLESTQAFYGGEAAMEKMMSDLSALYTQQLAPTVSDIEALGASSYHPALADVSYPQYEYVIPNVGGDPISETRTVSAGPNEGLMAYIIPMTLGVTARGPRGSEVKMEREIEVALIPVFQFGIFSDTDLSYFPGPDFDFAGRVHTNGSLFVCTSNSNGLTFRSKITAVEEVIRAETANGLTVFPNRDEPILIPTAPGGCDGAQPACRDLQENEGSKVTGPTSADNTNWPGLSLTTYNGFVLNGDTGAKALDLPFVSPGVRPIQIIRRPPSGEDPNSLVSQSRLYNAAQLRILISDDPAEHPGSAGVRLRNVSPYYDGTNYGATNTAFAEASTTRTPTADYVQPPSAGSTWPLVDGYLLVESRRADGSYVNVTEEWLDLGIARENPDAILKFQACEWNTSSGVPLGGCTMTDAEDHLALKLYDAREGEVRRLDPNNPDNDCAIGGIMSVVELDVGNVKRWLEGSTGTTGGIVTLIVLGRKGPHGFPFRRAHSHFPIH